MSGIVPFALLKILHEPATVGRDISGFYFFRRVCNVCNVYNAGNVCNVGDVYNVCNGGLLLLQLWGAHCGP